MQRQPTMGTLSHSTAGSAGGNSQGSSALLQVPQAQRAHHPHMQSSETLQTYPDDPAFFSASRMSSLHSAGRPQYVQGGRAPSGSPNNVNNVSMNMNIQGLTHNYSANHSNLDNVSSIAGEASHS